MRNSHVVVLALVAGLMLVGPVFADHHEDANEPVFVPSLVAHLKFDGDVFDVYGNVNEPNLVGDVNFVDGVYGQALTLDGEGDYVNLGAEFGPGVMAPLDSFSISVWYQGAFADQVGSTFPRILQWGNSDNNEYVALLPFTTGTPDAPSHQGAMGGIRFELKKPLDDGHPKTMTIHTEPIDSNEWTHAVVALDADANMVNIYVNGELAVSEPNVMRSAATVEVYNECTLGTAVLSKNKNYLKGDIDDLRVYNYALSATQAASLASGTVAAYPLDGDAVDASGISGDGTIYGDPTFAPGAVNDAIVLDGVDDFVSMPQILNNDAFTVAYWVNTTDGSPEVNWWMGKGLVSMEAGGCIGDWGTTLARGGKVIAIYGDQELRCNEGFPELESSMDVNDGNWHHVAFTFTAYDVMNLYIDGVLDQSTATGQLKLRGDLKGFSLIGAVSNARKTLEESPPFDGRYLNGMIDDVILYDRALSAEEVAGLAAVQ